MFKKKNQDPILVIVRDGRYECYGPVTDRSEYLYRVLTSRGGVNESVPDGRYHFNVVRRGFKFVFTLLPVED